MIIWNYMAGAYPTMNIFIYIFIILFINFTFSKPGLIETKHQTALAWINTNNNERPTTRDR